MKQINDEDAYELLHGAGFTVLEISRLIRMRQRYKVSELDQITHEDTPYVSPSEKVTILKTFVAALSIKSIKRV
jgi:hypothetical protein